MMCHVKRMLIGGSIIGVFFAFVWATIYYEQVDNLLYVIVAIVGLVVAYALGSLFVEDPKNKEDTSRIDWGERGSR